MIDYLFVCSANKLRSPTCEHVARLMGFSANSVGTAPDYVGGYSRALSDQAIAEARRVVCMEEYHASCVRTLAPERDADIEVWNIPDIYDYCQPELVDIVRERLSRDRGG